MIHKHIISNKHAEIQPNKHTLHTNADHRQAYTYTTYKFMHKLTYVKHLIHRQIHIRRQNLHKYTQKLVRIT
jgi:hypothetical protein